MKYLKKMIKINIKNFKQLGSDRIVNSIKGKEFKNCLIIDFGTATTFDIVKNETYEGGVIAPGIKLSIKNLSQSTALLPMFDLKKKQKSYGKNTKEALASGFFWGYAGLIDNIINLIKKETKKSFDVVITGGFSKLFKNSIKTKAKQDFDITINGLIKASKLIK